MAQAQRVSSLPRPIVNERLNGWKEIASYIGKSVRSAQRWEHVVGLPVHRLYTVRGQIVFGFRHEIDNWQLSSGSLLPRPKVSD